MKAGVPNNQLRKVFDKVTSPLQTFLKLEASSGIFLLATAIIALIFANTESLKAYYFQFIQTPVSVSVAGYALQKNLLLLVNDGLMAIFFFLVGLEIKRELLVGELSTARKAAFSFFAAIGGMIVPALIFVAFNWGSESISGWGIPMATDIAFAIGIITLLGKRVPPALKIFLLALAIVDDLGAILIIALFYSNEIASQYLGIAAACLFLLYLLNHLGFRSLTWGLILGTITWFCFLKSGVHATIAGVLLAFLTPAWSTEEKAEERTLLLDHYIHDLHPWAAFLIMPIFAFFNAGVEVTGLNFSEVLTSPVSLGIIAGLVLGKPIGVFTMTFLATRMKWAELPKDTTWPQIISVGLIAGIGFTMSLFISSLAFSDDVISTYSKISILTASVITMVLGYTSLRMSTEKA